MSSICLIDTSIFLEILNVPNYNQPATHPEAQRLFNEQAIATLAKTNRRANATFLKALLD